MSSDHRHGEYGTEHDGRAIGRLLAVAATLAVTPALSVTLAAAAGTCRQP